MPDRDALLNILEHIDRIQRNVTVGPSTLDDEVVEAAVLRWLGVIGEAANRVSRQITDRHPDVPWRRIVNMRNLLVHR
jgi:uncharacterized protein with HEPN domain